MTKPSDGGRRPAANSLVRKPDALLTRTDLRELGLERRAVDAVFRALNPIVLPGYSRPLIKASEFLELIEESSQTGEHVR